MKHDTYLTAGLLIRQLAKCHPDTPVLALRRKKGKGNPELGGECNGSDLVSIVASGSMSASRKDGKEIEDPDVDNKTIFVLEIKK